MNILKQNLASLSPGTHVRITQQNGHVLDGIVLENDGTESLSVRVALTAVLSYDGIAGIETSDNAAGTVVEIPKTVPQKEITDSPAPKNKLHEEPPAPVKTAALFPPGNPADIQKIQTTRINSKAAIDNMVNDKMKKVCRPLSDKFQSHLKSRDASKLREVAARAKLLMKENEWWYDADYNLFYAWIVLDNKDFVTAADSFFYANQSINAARAAYHGAAEAKNEELYDLAGAAAVHVLLDKDAHTDYDEAVEILKLCAAKRSDISFVPRLLENGGNLQKQYLSRILWYICGCSKIALTDPENIDESREKLEASCNQSGILTELRRLLGEDIEPEEDPDEYDMEKLYEQYDTEPSEDTEPSAEKPKPISAKNFEGYIVDYQPSGSGVLRGSSGKTYPFTESTVRENDLLEALRAAAGKTPFPYISAEFAVTRSGDTESVTAVRYKKIPGTSDPFVEASPYSGKVHALMEAKKYDEIYPIGQELIDSGNIDDGCYYYFQAYLAALKQNPSDAETRSAMERLADKYASVITKNLKNTELLRQVYQKLQKIPEQIEMLNRMLELTPAIEYARLLAIYTQKADCYTELKDYPSAVAQLKVYQELLNKIPASTKNFTSRNQTIAELYLRMEDWENAKKYAALLTSDQKKAIL
ncbi:MAG: hypothetical protein II333_11415, partial [Clostridia bacterium]|nr:hypothetical protein [Clostridia bacterium]